MDYLVTLHPVRELGRGAFGIVHLCNHDIHGEVAAKCFYQANFGDEAEWRAATARAVAEGQALRALEHPHVVRVYDVVRSPDDSELVIVMSYCSGGSAREVAAINTLNLSESRKIIRDAAFGICYIHNRGYIHRDIKPDNILLTADRKGMVADFGFVTDNFVLGFARPYGTPLYLAPEVLINRGCNNSSDIYSLGVTFLHLTHGDLWLSRQGTGQLFKWNAQGYPYLSDSGLYLPHLPVAWRTCLNRLTHADPAKRCQSMDEAVDLIVKLPAVEDWTCVVGPDVVEWSLRKAGRTVHVEWKDYLRKGGKWRAWSQNDVGRHPRTLGKSVAADTPIQSYRRLQAFFAGRRP